jgi:hypothetical protein
MLWIIYLLNFYSFKNLNSNRKDAAYPSEVAYHRDIFINYR